MVSSGGDSAQVGVAKLTGEVFATVERLPRLVESLSGYDMTRACHTPGITTGTGSSTGTASTNMSARFK